MAPVLCLLSPWEKSLRKDEEVEFFVNSDRRLGRARAREWLRENGYQVESPPLDLTGLSPDVYGKTYTHDQLLEVVAVVETEGSIGSEAARDRMRACGEWSREGGFKKKVLFVPRDSVRRATRTLTDYDGMVLY